MYQSKYIIYHKERIICIEMSFLQYYNLIAFNRFQALTAFLRMKENVHMK